MLQILPAQTEDTQVVQEIANVCFADFGEYGKLIGRFFSAQGVHSYLAWENGEAVGFVVCGFFPWSLQTEEDYWIADLLAIAVLPDFQRKGIASRLLDQVFELVEQMAQWREIKETQLSCAHTNQAGIALFEKFGFRVIDKNHGTYSGGQQAWRFSKVYTNRFH